MTETPSLLPMTSHAIAESNTFPTKDSQKPKPFSRYESMQDGPHHRSRANTLPNRLGTGRKPEDDQVTPKIGLTRAESEDVFAGRDDGYSTDSTDGGSAAPQRKFSEAFEELPIEIRSLTERFLESLSAKVHPTPLSIDALSDMFQTFYTRADSHIAAHISALSSRLSRESSPTPSMTFKGPYPQKGRLGSSSNAASKDSSLEHLGDQQMLTTSEVTNRRRLRRQLEHKRVALEEAVERVVCEKVYDRIWRHRSTDDEQLDEKLRSRAAALSLVGIGIKELHISADSVDDQGRSILVEKEEEIREWLAGARTNLKEMDKDRYPLGKLHHLTAAHKSIVEALSHVFPSSSSADEILPTLIYAIMTCSTEELNIVSHLKFIQRFRSAKKVGGEAAYCLVNLEAAISFLETVDLSSLRSEEKSKITSKAENRSPEDGPVSAVQHKRAALSDGSLPAKALTSSPSSDSIVSATEDKGQSTLTPPGSRSSHQRRLSNLIQSQTNRLEAVRDDILGSADQAFDSINSTLENSFRFIFGRLREQQAHSGQDGSQDTILPKTLEDARKLVSTPPPLDDDANVSVTGHSEVSFGEPDVRGENKLLELIGGKRPNRDRSVDSSQSAGSGRRVTFAHERIDHGNVQAGLPIPPQAPTSAPSTGANSAVESMRNLGNTLNPLNRLTNMSIMPRFGRAATSTPPEKSPCAEPDTAGKTGSRAASDETKVAPPIKRFVEAKDARDLKVGEVEDLLKDYQRLAAALSKSTPP